MIPSLDVDVAAVHHLAFEDGAPVRAASAIAAFEDGWLVASDDATHAAVWTRAGINRLRVLPPVKGHDLFDELSGTKRLKPDLEAACRVDVGAAPAVLLLGSGSLPTRMRAVLVEEGTRRLVSADLGPLYRRVAAALDVPLEDLNLEGACVVADALRWFQRGSEALGIPSASVDLDLGALVDAVRGGPAEAVEVGAPRTYALEGSRGGALAVTDAIVLPDGRVLVAAAAEDTPNAVDDGPVVDAAVVLLDGEMVVARGDLPAGPDGPEKVEGLALSAVAGDTASLVAVVDADDPGAPSRALELTVTLPSPSERTSTSRRRGGPRTRSPRGGRGRGSGRSAAP